MSGKPDEVLMKKSGWMAPLAGKVFVDCCALRPLTFDFSKENAVKEALA